MLRTLRLKILRAGISVVSAAGLLLSGCGSVGEPLPPLLNIPERSRDLSAQQTVDGVLLGWTWPQTTTEGMPLTDLARFTIHIMELTAPFEAPHVDIFELNSRIAASLEPHELSASGAGDRIRFVLKPDEMAGKAWAIGVRGESSRHRWVGFSNLTVIEVIAPPGRPGKPEITLEPGAVVIAWKAAAEANSYRLLRAGDGSGKFEPIGETDGLSFRDTSFQWNQGYAYRVQSLGRSSTGVALGPASPTVSVFTKDTFPPAAPLRVQAIAAPGVVELSWQPSSEPDLVGYLVRRASGESPAVLLTEDPITTPGYSDTTAEPGRTHRYTIQAVDQDGNASRPSDEVAVTIP